MRYSQIRAFHHVAIHGGFSRAAEALSLTQPAVSEQVRKLEVDHDVLLFDRGQRQVTLTQAGAQLLICTKKLFEVEDEITEVLSEGRTALEGRLRIIADSAFHLTTRLRAFRQRHPGVFISLRTGNTAQITRALRSYDAEIGVVGAKGPGADMLTRDLGTSPIVAFAAHSLALPAAMTFAEIAAYPLVFREEGSKTRQEVERAAADAGLPLTPAIEATGREAVREVVAEGAGIGFVSRAEFGHDDRLAQIEITDSDLTMTETLICLRQRRDVRLIRSFMEMDG
ncbi:LysR family transcriptional regulator [Roseovarius sp. LXJ103]|uniref:LysR substrate-binding domain-containing protein n=1 Tax=Roseovarius carneus TaxID=2853164 RepID=UPI000D60B8D5|nr:LysR substrate-binding domain-containing protein [Roseovarius carneus]MBZ8119565.1 LysR family transcriptional regulator [Roseovarius carneus]PWE34812.1 LysR family transcriptional regulator [Pelagicola sp. LXJ1103]